VGPDFRLHDPADYPRWYKFDHPAAELLAQAVYGLPELYRDEMRAAADRAATIIGLPGCYPTATILTLAPLARAGLIGDLVVDAKSGVSGAGREPKPDLLFSEVNESVKAYGLFSHRHTAEMEQELQAQGELGPMGSREANPGVATVDFLPHLIPMTRASWPAATCGRLARDPGGARRPVRRGLSRRTVRPGRGRPAGDQARLRKQPVPDLRQGRPAQRSRPGPWRHRQPRQGRRRQAVQALNVLFGLPEATGLEQYPIAP